MLVQPCASIRPFKQASDPNSDKFLLCAPRLGVIMDIWPAKASTRLFEQFLVASLQILIGGRTEFAPLSAFIRILSQELDALPAEADPEDVVFDSLVDAGKVLKGLSVLLTDELMLETDFQLMMI